MENWVEAQRRWRQLDARTKTIVADLRGLEGFDQQLKTEAAEVIEWLLEHVAALQKELNDEIREGESAARDAYAQGRQDEFWENK